MPLQQLTKRQKAIYEYIRERIQSGGYAPTVREIGTRFGIQSPNGVMCHLRALTKKGFIRREVTEQGTGLARAIQLTEPVQQQEARGLPLKGRVSAGTLHEAVEQDDRIDFGEIFQHNDLYALQISGNSMIEAHIKDGDYVVIEPRADAHKGEMVVARTEDGEATLKYWFPEKNRIRLQPANSEMKPIYVKNVTVLGAVVGVVRKFN